MADIRFYLGLTGGTSVKLDGKATSSLANNETAIGMDGFNFRVYKYSTTEAGSENSPFIIIPDDNASGTGAWVLMTKRVFYPDASQADHGAAVGNLVTVKDCVDAIGTSSQGTIVLQRGASGNSTSYIFLTSETTTSNIDIKVENGAMVAPATGKTVTIYSPENIDAGTRQRIFTGDGLVAFTSGGVRYAEWWGGDADGTTAGQEVFINKALAAGADPSVVKLHGGTYLLSNPVVINDYNNLIGTNFMRTTLQADANMDDNVVETYEFDNWDAYPDGVDASWDGGAQHLLPTGFQIFNLRVNGNKDNNASGHGFAINGNGYQIDRIQIYQCKDNGWYSNVDRDNGVNTPASTSIDNNPETIIGRMAVKRCNGTNIYFDGPNDAIWENISTNSSETGYGIQIVSDINIGYIHSYSNDLANVYATTPFSCRHMEARDGWRENAIFDMTGSLQIDSLFTNNADRDDAGYDTITWTDGQGQIGMISATGKVDGTGDVLNFVAGSPKLGTVKIFSNGGTGKALTTINTVNFLKIESIEVEDFHSTAEAGLIEIGGDKGHIGSIIQNKAGVVHFTSTAGDNIVDSILVETPNDTTSTYSVKVSGDANQVGKIILKGTTNATGVEIVAGGNNNIIGPVTFDTFGGTDKITDAGSNNVVLKGVGDEEVINTDAQTLSIHGVTQIETLGVGALAGTLPDAYIDGHRKIIMMNTDGGDYTLSVTSHVTSDPESFVFDDNADYLVLEWSRNQWVTALNVGVSVP